ncbi:MAG: FkbM family methyltransferase [Gemmatimonadaceae bacterium]
MTPNALTVALKQLTRRAGFDVVKYPERERVPLADFLQRFHIDTVLDVGANCGQYGSWLRSLAFRGKIISFEPNPVPFAELQRVAKADGNWSCQNIGLGATNTSLPINISELDVFSSMLPVGERLRTLDPRANVEKVAMVPVKRLDDLTDVASLSPNTLLKIDTQGFEGPVLEGASGVLQRLRGVQLELSLTPLYEGQARFETIVAWLVAAGFVPFAFWDGFVDAKTGAVLEMDGLFFRPDAAIRSDS